MTEATIISELDDNSGTVTLTLNRPKLHNAFDDDMIGVLQHVLREVEVEPAIRLVVLAANGQSFSAGADANWMQRIARYSESENLADARKLAELMRTLNELAKPTIAKVQGAAFGGGVGLAACCDIVVASEKASFCLSEVKLGLIPAVISPYVVRAIGEQQARRYFLTAERFDAREAKRIGLVHEVVAADMLDDRVDKFIKTMTENGPNAMVAGKALVRAVASGSIDESMIEDTVQRIAGIRASEEGQEGLEAFLNKRKPDWVAG